MTRFATVCTSILFLKFLVLTLYLIIMYEVKNEVLFLSWLGLHDLLFG